MATNAMSDESMIGLSQATPNSLALGTCPPIEKYQIFSSARTEEEQTVLECIPQEHRRKLLHALSESQKKESLSDLIKTCLEVHQIPVFEDNKPIKTQLRITNFGLSCSLLYRGQKVVEKMLRRDYSTLESRYLAIEALIGFNKYPCFIKVIGFMPPIAEGCSTFPIYKICDSALIMEYAAGGSLAALLDECRHERRQQLSSDQIKILLLGISFGMKTVIEAGLLYKILRPDNVLLTADLEPMLGDFGLEYSKYDYTILSDEEERYIDPCYVGDGLTYYEGNDVFSFAMTAYEIVTGQLSFGPNSNGVYAQNCIRRGQRPVIPDDCPYKSLLERCWVPDVLARPTFADIFDELYLMADSDAVRNYITRLTNPVHD